MSASTILDSDSDYDSDEVKFQSLDITSLHHDADADAADAADADDAAEAADEEEVADDDEEIDYVVLGFVEKPENSQSLLPHFFPSKAGGFPAWLDPVNLPSGQSVLCDICGDPLQFMLQVYAGEDNNECAYHRTLFVFTCTSMDCLRRDQNEQAKRLPHNPLRSVKVFRCQLPRSNPFYSSEPAKINDEPYAAGAELCTWCGTWKGIKECSGCRKALYCSEKHWLMHSQQGHDGDCQRTHASDLRAACTTLWKEFEITLEDEIEFEPSTTGDDKYSKSVVSTKKTDGLTELFVKGFECDDETKTWASFQHRVDWAKKQVLRYHRDPDAKPLWPMLSGQPSKPNIPPCRYCDGPLGFEFQIMPQLLHYFDVEDDIGDSFDWATIAVYTCEASCDASVAYKEEFAWVQIDKCSQMILRGLRPVGLT